MRSIVCGDDAVIVKDFGVLALNVRCEPKSRELGDMLIGDVITPRITVRTIIRIHVYHSVNKHGYRNLCDV